MNLIEQPAISTEAIAAWLTQKKNALVAILPHGATSFRATCSNFAGEGSTVINFECYNEKVGHSADSKDPDKAVDNFRHFVGQYSPSEQARAKREKAAALIAEAEKLEAQTN